MQVDLNELSLGELRELYPDLKATSKKVMLEKIAESTVVIVDELDEVDKEKFSVEDEIFTWHNILGYITAISKGNERVLIKCPTAIEADFLWSRCKSELFPVLQEKGITIMSSSTRRDVHLNGTCYVRFVCHTKFEHFQKILKYTTLKELV